MCTLKLDVRDTFALTSVVIPDDGDVIYGAKTWEILAKFIFGRAARDHHEEP